MKMKLLVKGIGQLVTVCEGRRFLAGKEMADITVRSGCLAVAVDLQGNIAMVGSEGEVTVLLPLSSLHYNLIILHHIHHTL